MEPILSPTGDAAETIARLADQAATSEPIPISVARSGTGVLAFVHRDDQTIEYLDTEKYAEEPFWKRGYSAVTTSTSLSAYVQAHQTDATTLWAKLGSSEAKIIAVLNDHGSVAAGRGDHRTALALQATPDWTHWLTLDGKLLGQEQFAEHLEDGAEAIREPTAADMLEIAQTFHAKRGVTFASSNRLASGEVQFVYEETITAKTGQKGQLAVPEQFTLGLIPFEGGDQPYALKARFRYRLAEGVLTMGYRLIRPDLVRKAAFTDVISEVQEATGLQVLFGVPSGANERIPS